MCVYQMIPFFFHTLAGIAGIIGILSKLKNTVLWVWTMLGQKYNYLWSFDVD